MGLLTEGKVESLTFEEIQEWKEHIKTHGIIQFCGWYNKVKDINYDTLKWGDEIELMMIRFNDDTKSAPLFCKAKDILQSLQKAEQEKPGETETAWRPEFTEYMIECSPGRPYGGNIVHFNTVEANMKLRRDELFSYFKDSNEQILSLSTYPRLGCMDTFYPPIKNNIAENDATRSYAIPDAVLNQLHIRFKNLAKMITKRKGRKAFKNIPIFRDSNTANPFIDPLVPENSHEDREVMLPNHVHLDCVTAGLGCGCLQVTFQACNVTEARMLYDQNLVLAPIVLALSASTPAVKGCLVDTDTRWENLSGLCDDRKPEETGELPPKNGLFRIPKSRYASADMYLAPENKKLNDIEVVYRDDHLKILLDAGIDRQMAEHVAHLFIRDPLAVYREKLEIDDEDELDHFENIQSTNYQTVRFKPPPPQSNIGWRVEMRPMETQLTDFENAAYVTFVVLLTRVVLSYDLTLTVPISKVEQNVNRASRRDAISQEKFFFRKNLGSQEDDTCEEMTLNEIINGKGEDFPGLVPVIHFYLNHLDIDADTRCTISQYLKLISMRASGELMTTAKWMRTFIRSHPKYKFDSIISEEINYDLLKTCVDITNGDRDCPELFAADRTSRSCQYVPEKCSRMLEEVEQIAKDLTGRNTATTTVQ